MRTLSIEVTKRGWLLLDEPLEVSAHLLYHVADPRKDSLQNAPPNLIEVRLQCREGALKPCADDVVRFDAVDGATFMLRARAHGELRVERWPQ